MKICGKSPHFFKSEKKKSRILHEGLTTFQFCRDVNSPQKQFCATLNIFILLTMTLAQRYRQKRILEFAL